MSSFSMSLYLALCLSTPWSYTCIGKQIFKNSWFWDPKYDHIYKLIECHGKGLLGRIFVTEVLKFGWAIEYSTGISWDWYKYVYFNQYLGNSYENIWRSSIKWIIGSISQTIKSDLKAYLTLHYRNFRSLKTWLNHRTRYIRKL